jgi:DNA-binding transcriptional MerR regulator/methylmalonyl-CoA mutase cobalamin-binding subunit
MSSPSQTPTFNLKAVVKETGIKPDTLRAWERRYGLPQPERTPGGHRLYSERDIEIVKWLCAHQEQGMRISQAVELWHRLEAEGQDPLQAERVSPPEPLVTEPPSVEGVAIAELRQAWKSACLSFDERVAEQILSQAFALYPVEVVCLELLQKGLSELGDGWYEGEVTVQQEHFASELAMRRLEALVAATPFPTRSERILVACPPQEEHTFSPLLITLLLRRRGWDVLYLGANVPIDRIERAINMARPDLVVLSAQQLHTAATLFEMAQELQKHNVPLVFGGLIFNRVPDVRSRIAGHFLGESVDQVPQAVGQMLASPPPSPVVRPVSDAYQQAAAHYRDDQALIGSQVWRALQSHNIHPDHLTIANTHLRLNIRAALTLGDMDYLGSDIAWTEGLLENYGVPVEWLTLYLQTYRQAAIEHLGERGKLIIDWLTQVTENSRV